MTSSWPNVSSIASRFLPSFVVLLAAPPAGAQCPFEWRPGEVPGVVGSATVFASTTWDPDGPGPQAAQVVFGGTMIGAGDIPVRSVAAWDGSKWLALGDGLNDQVRALTVYNGQLIAAAGNNTFGGTGPANGVARWDGTSWQALSSAGFQNAVRALTVFSGELIAGGIFNSAGGTAVANIARWNGTAWQPMGVGIAGGVTALAVFNGELLAASSTIMRWNGSTWQPFSPALTGNVNAFATHNGELVIGGTFRTAPGGPVEEVARWDGTAWQPLGGGMNDFVSALAVFNGELIAGGLFTMVEGIPAPRIARWNGAFWSPMTTLGRGIPGRRCDSLIEYNGELYAGGAQTKPSGVQAEHVGRWDGFEWNYVGSGFDAIVYDLASYNGELIAGGWFSTAGNGLAQGIARRDSTGQWQAMGAVSGGDGFVFDLVVYNGVLVASGSFTAIDGVPASNGTAQWDGVSWQPFGTVDVGIAKKLVHNGELYAPGGFGPNQKVARWDPVAQNWQPIGVFPTNAGITCLTFFEGDLIAGGIGGIGVNASVWRWDFDAPGTWQPIGQHLGFGLVQTLGVYNGELLVGGNIDGGLARFDGTSWVPLGGGLFLGNESPDEVLAVFDLRVFNGDLVVAGTFSYAGAQQYTPGTVAAFHVASWNGTNWQALGGGTNDAVVSLHEHDGELHVGGWFDIANGRPAAHWAHWGPSCAPGDLNCDQSVNAADAAPFVSGLLDPSGLDVCGRVAADVNGDGLVDGADITEFVACVVLGGCP